ncbi:MAG: 30S ribosome-binding factor RbfA [Marinilabiliaceae bacterium]|nr:30S ribosome-binding factor RbfA [Marinilabiliaceae bacterium]
MDTRRQNKISRLVQKEMGEIFRSEINELLLGTMVSVTATRVSADMSIAKIYISIFPTEHKDEVFKKIVNHCSKIRYLFGMRVGKQLRIIPELHFFIDDSLDYIENIDNLLNR